MLYHLLIFYGTALPITECGRRVVSPAGLRAPEVYLAGPWNEKVDIWSYGCLVRLQLATGLNMM